MMVDRELLEMAAKAAGMDDLECGAFGFYRVIGAHDDGKKCMVEWNPLTDDGDAFRFVVKLGLFNDDDFVAELKAIWMYSCTDYYAATRRAIVCAAAEMGKSIT